MPGSDLYAKLIIVFARWLPNRYRFIAIQQQFAGLEVHGELAALLT